MKTEVTWVSYSLNDVLKNIPVKAKSILDCGCGRGITGALVRIYRNPVRLVGIDIYEPYVKFCRKYNLYDEVYRRDLTKPLPFKDKEFDVVTCLETIEHLNKENGMALLKELERVGKFVVITTPTRFFRQDTFDGNPYQQHKRLWSPKEFKQRGYMVRGVGCLFIIFGKQIRYFSFFLAKFAYFLPQFSTIMLAHKLTTRAQLSLDTTN